MSTNERTGKRDLTYSAWHRTPNLAVELEPVFRHIADHHERRRRSHMAAFDCTMIDVDGLEYCRRCRAPLALIETKHQAATTKSTAVLERLGEAALLPVYLVEYGETEGALRFRVTRRYPTGGPHRHLMTSHEYAAFVLGIHTTDHRCA